MTEIKINQPDLVNQIKSLPNITETQIARWQMLQSLVDRLKQMLTDQTVQSAISNEDTLINNLNHAERILKETKFSFIFFGGTGVGKSTIINALVGRDLLPASDGASVTGVITVIEQAPDGADETFTIEYWSSEELADWVKLLCNKSNIEPFDIRNDNDREVAQGKISKIQSEAAQKGEMANTINPYVAILDEYIKVYEKNRNLYKNGTMDNDSILIKDTLKMSLYKKHIDENEFKGDVDKRKIRLIKYAKYSIHPPNGMKELFLNGHLRIMDVPGLGAGIPLHEEITQNEMKSQDAMIGVVADSLRTEDDKAQKSFKWLDQHHLSNFPEGEDRNNAAAKIFIVLNLREEKRETYEKIQRGSSIRKVIDDFVSNKYWSKYTDRGKNGRPFFIVMPRPALFAQGVTGDLFERSAENVLKDFGDLLPERNLSTTDLLLPKLPANKEAIMEFSEIDHLRHQISAFVKNNRIDNKMNEAESGIRRLLSYMLTVVEASLESKGITPDTNQLEQERKDARQSLENTLAELTDAIRRAIRETSQEFSENSESKIKPFSTTIGKEIHQSLLNEIKAVVKKDTIHYESIFIGEEGEEIPLKRILMQLQTDLMWKIFKYVRLIAADFYSVVENKMNKYDIKKMLKESSFSKEKEYTFRLLYCEQTSAGMGVLESYDTIIKNLKNNFEHTIQQSTIYEIANNDRFKLKLRYFEDNKSLTYDVNSDDVISRISFCVESICKEIIEHDILSKGCNRLFRWELDKLRDALLSLSEDLKNKNNINLENDEELRRQIIQKNSDNFSDTGQLLSFRETIVGLQRELLKHD